MRWFVVIPFLIIISCSKKFENFKQQPSGLWVQLLSLEDSSVRIENGGYVQFRYEIKNSSENILSSARILLKVNDAQQEGGLVEALRLLNIKEKGRFIFPYGKFKNELKGTLGIEELPDTALLYAEVQIDHVFDSMQFYSAQEEFLAWVSSTDTSDFQTQKEILLLDEYEKKSSKRFQYSTSGMRYAFIQRNKGSESVSYGKRVAISYNGKFMDGTVFNSTQNLDNEVQDFYIGQEMQVIKGIEEVLLKMNEGDEVEVLLPSWLAFGKKGSTTGKVPPSTPVVYSITLKSVN